MQKYPRLRAAVAAALICAAGAQTGGAAVLMHETFTPPDGCPASGHSTWFPDGWSRFDLDGWYDDAAFVEGWSITASRDGTCAAAAEAWYSWGAPRDYMCTPPLALPQQSWIQWADMHGSSQYRLRAMRAPPALDGSNLDAESELVADPPPRYYPETKYLALHDHGYANETVFVCFENYDAASNGLSIGEVMLRDQPLLHDPELVRVTLPAYSRIPLNQAVPFELHAEVANSGSGDLSEVRVSGLVRSYTPDRAEWPVFSDAIPLLAAGDHDSLSLGTVEFERPGSWHLAALVEAAEEDSAPFNATIDTPVTWITDLTLARANESTGLHVGTFGEHPGAEMGQRIELARNATIVAASFWLADVSGQFWPRVPLGGASITAHIRSWDAQADQPGQAIVSATASAGSPSTGRARVHFRFPPVRLSAGRYLVSMVDPDVVDEPIPLVMAKAKRERGTGWMNWPGNPDGWLRFGDVDPDVEDDLYFELTIVGDHDHYPIGDEFELLEDHVYTGSVAGNDLVATGATHVWSIPHVPNNIAWAEMDEHGGFSMQPAPNFHGTVWMSYSLCVEDVCRVAGARFVVHPVDEGAPIAANDSFVVPSDRWSLLDLGANDVDSPDGGSRWRVLTAPSAGEVYGSGEVNEFWYVPDQESVLELDGFTYELCDSDGDCSVAEVELTIVPIIFRNSFED